MSVCLGESQFVLLTPKAPHAGPGTYRRIVVLETDGSRIPAMASARARGVKRIIYDSGPVREGTTERSRYQQLLTYAQGILWDCRRDHASDFVPD